MLLFLPLVTDLYVHIFTAPVQTMHTGLDLGSVEKVGLGDTTSPLSSPSWTPNMTPVSALMGPSPLVRGMSGSGLGRLQRVGSNPINDMNRHSFSQVLASRLVALVPPSLLYVCMHACVCLCMCMYVCMHVCMHQSYLDKSWISAKAVLVAACSNTADELLHPMLSSILSFFSWRWAGMAMTYTSDFLIAQGPLMP